MTDLGIVDLLKLCGFDPDSRSKLVRHQDKRYDAHDLLRRGWLEAYQQYQSRPVFDGLDYIVSFVGTEGTHSRLFGIYKVLGQIPPEARQLPVGCPYIEWQKNPYCYNLERQSGYAALEHRVVIDWGRAALAWHQHTTNKTVVEVLQKGQLLNLFSDYLDFTLTHAELRYLFEHTESNREWRARLAAVAGVYLILASTTGHQYVGSAYGADGFWGRWGKYAANGHGGNVQLRQLLSADPAYPAAFTYSILQILPRTAAKAEILRLERHYKAKLGSIATGLNSN